MSASASFRDFAVADKSACLDLFDANCPEYFAVNEREDYTQFLDTNPDDYEVCEAGGELVAAFGLLRAGDGSHSLNWIMLDPNAQGIGLGSTIMNRVIAKARALVLPTIQIAASHKSAPFFARFGARETKRTENGWGPGMHRVDMELVL